MTPTHPDLRAIRFLPGFSWGPRLTGLVRRVRPRPADLGPEVTASELHLPGTAGNPDVTVRLLRPALAEGPTPLLLWVHGGGLISGSPEQDDRANAASSGVSGSPWPRSGTGWRPTPSLPPPPRTCTAPSSRWWSGPDGWASTRPGSRSGVRARVAGSPPLPP